MAILDDHPVMLVKTAWKGGGGGGRGRSRKELPRGKHSLAAFEWDELEAECQGQAVKQQFLLCANIYHQPPGLPSYTSLLCNPQFRAQMDSFLQNFTAKGRRRKKKNLYAAYLIGGKQRGGWGGGQRQPLILCQGLDSHPAIRLHQWTRQPGISPQRCVSTE